jgi:hypothetical protein
MRSSLSRAARRLFTPTTSLRVAAVAKAPPALIGEAGRLMAASRAERAGGGLPSCAFGVSVPTLDEAEPSGEERRPTRASLSNRRHASGSKF